MARNNIKSKWLKREVAKVTDHDSDKENRDHETTVHQEKQQPLGLKILNWNNVFKQKQNLNILTTRWSSFFSSKKDESQLEYRNCNTARLPEMTDQI